MRRALSIIPPTMPPTMVIATGNGAHAWWLFKEPYIFDDAEDRKDTATPRVPVADSAALARVAARLGLRPVVGFGARVADPRHGEHQGPAQSEGGHVHSATDRRYNLSDFEEYLDDAAIPDPEAEEKATREWAERFADKPLVINTRRAHPAGNARRLEWPRTCGSGTPGCASGTT